MKLGILQKSDVMQSNRSFSLFVLFLIELGILFEKGGLELILYFVLSKYGSQDVRQDFIIIVVIVYRFLSIYRRLEGETFI